MTMRQIRQEAAHRELASRHPWMTIFGRPLGVAAAVLVSATVMYFSARAVWHAVSRSLAADPSVPATVPGAVPDPSSWMPWWAWAVLAVAVLVLAIRYVPRIHFRMKWGIWSTR